MMQTAQIILDQMVLVKVEATIYGARKKLKIEDLMLVDGIPEIIWYRRLRSFKEKSV